MKPNQIEPIEVGYTDEDKVIFHLRKISIAESDELDAKMADAESAADKHKNLYLIRLEALKDYSVEMPEKYVKENGELKRVPLNDATTANVALQEHFSERSLENEWVIRDAFIRFKQALQPSSRYLSFFE